MSISADFQIRKAGPDDADALAEVHVRSWQETYTGIVPSSHLESLDPAKRVAGWRATLSEEPSEKILWVADFKSAGVQGFVIAGPARSPDFPDYGEVRAIYLRRRFQGIGTGRALFATALRSLKDVGYGQAYLWVLEQNPTRKFYESAGGILSDKSAAIEIGGARLTELAYTWDLKRLLG